MGYVQFGDSGSPLAAGVEPEGAVCLAGSPILFFRRQSREVRQLLPDLNLHGLASGDFEWAPGAY